MARSNRHQGRGSRLRGGALISVLGLLLFLVHVRHVVLMDSWLGVLLEAVLPLLVSIGLVGFGASVIRGGVVDDRDVTRLVGWYLAGMLALSLVGFWIVAHGYIRGVPTPHAFSVLMNAVTVGGLVGAVIGTYDARKHEFQRKLVRERDRLEDFANVVSHDLRNPINVAMGNLEMVRDRRPNERLDVAQQSLERCLGIIDDVLTLAKGGRVVGDVRRVELSRVAETAWAGVETLDASLLVERSVEIEADTSRLQEVFENLFRNAVEHGGEDVSVRVGAMDGGFYVADDGPGIPSGAGDEVFGVGYSTSDGGTGLGLNIVREIVRAHGWTIRVPSRGAGGTRFEITGVDAS